MKDQLFIPTVVKVGYRERNDTYTGKLAYIIYKDSKGVLRKEASFESWRDKKIDTEELDNKPHSGFVLNKDVKRDSSWFGSGRNMIRVYDTRGMEFEITTGNLLFILMTTDCIKRDLVGEFVYSWYGPELVLLPTGCEEYKNSAEFTKLQAQKVSSKSLVKGYTYRTKKQEDLVYLGRFSWRNSAPYYNFYHKGKTDYNRKHYLFMSKSSIVAFTDLKSIAELVSDCVVPNYAELMEIVSSDERSNPVTAIEERPYIPDIAAFKTREAKRYYGYYSDGSLLGIMYKKLTDNSYNIYKLHKYNQNDSWSYRSSLRVEYRLSNIGILSMEKGSFEYNIEKEDNYRLIDVETFDLMQFVDLELTLERGEKVSVNNYFNVKF